MPISDVKFAVDCKAVMPQPTSLRLPLRHLQKTPQHY